MVSRCKKTAGDFFRAASLLALLLCISKPTTGTVKRKDVVVMKNGDHLTGDVKRMQNGLLYIETVYSSGTVAVDWNQVEKIESEASYQVTLDTGRRVSGKIEKVPSDNGDKSFVIRKPNGEERYSTAEIANIDAAKPTFWRQLKGSVDAGYSYTSGNSQTSLSSDANATYTKEKWSATGSFDSSFNGQAGASKTNKIDTQFSGDRLLNRNSFLIGITDLLHSSQQDLELRAMGGGGYGRYWIHTANTSFGWMAGADYTNEHFRTASGQPSDNNLEGLVGMEYDSYRFNFGEIHSQLLVFPGLTDAGRVRLTTNNSLTIKLTNKFHLSFSFWDNFDSRPPVTAKRNETGVSTDIGWSF